MGKTVALSGPSLELARASFLEYYRSHPPPLPSRFLRREFAYAPFSGTGMRRHLAMPSAEVFHRSLQEEVPRHLYYSSAYYEDPAHPIMVSKRWVGADLIFDLDADHLEDAGGLDYPGQLELVKRKFRVLVEDYLLRDFGLDVTDVQLAFSGGRGYHAHVHKESFLGLSSAGRRELVDYLGGGGVDLSSYLYPSESLEKKAPGRRAAAKAAMEATSPEAAPVRSKARMPKSTMNELPRFPPPDAPGWKGRFSRSFFELLTGWEKMSVAEATQDILARAKRRGIETMRPGDAFTVARALLEEGKAAKVREYLVLDVGSKGKTGHRGVPISFIELILAEGAVLLQGETDAPVTTDIHRLIRLPGSLHGGTGFRVRPLEIDQLREFSPMRDALLPDPTHGRAVEVRLGTAVDYPLGEQRVKGAEGEVLPLPLPHALFLILRGEGVLDGPRVPEPARAE